MLVNIAGNCVVVDEYLKLCTLNIVCIDGCDSVRSMETLSACGTDSQSTDTTIWGDKISVLVHVQDVDCSGRMHIYT